MITMYHVIYKPRQHNSDTNLAESLGNSSAEILNSLKNEISRMKIRSAQMSAGSSLVGKTQSWPSLSFVQSIFPLGRFCCAGKKAEHTQCFRMFPS